MCATDVLTVIILRGGGLPASCRLWGGVLVLYPLHAGSTSHPVVTNRNISSHGPWGQNGPYLRTTRVAKDKWDLSQHGKMVVVAHPYTTRLPGACSGQFTILLQEQGISEPLRYESQWVFFVSHFMPAGTQGLGTFISMWLAFQASVNSW